VSLWRGNVVSIVRFFPQTIVGFLAKDYIRAAFGDMRKDKLWKTFATNIVAGGIAGGLTLSVVYSLDTARVRLANDVILKGEQRRYSGAIDFYRKTLNTEGVRGLYRGFNISVIGIFLYRGLYMGLYDTAKVP
jgi:solute carrier family 25 (adenine nucleotide translocator) protein 4/5/6/31